MTGQQSLEAGIAALKVGLENLTSDVGEVKQAIKDLNTVILGNGQVGLKTAVCLIQKWIEEAERQRKRAEKRRWQFTLAQYGWLVSAILAIGSWVFALISHHIGG